MFHPFMERILNILHLKVVCIHGELSLNLSFTLATYNRNVIIGKSRDSFSNVREGYLFTLHGHTTVPM